MDQARGAAAARTARGTIAVLLAALAVRGVYLLVLARSPLFDFFRNDQLYYREWGLRIAAGDWIGSGVFEQGPLYAYLLGAAYRLVGPRDPLILALQLLAGLLTAWLLLWCGRRLWGPRAGLATGVLAALYGPFVFYEGMVMKTFLEPLLVTAALAASLRGLGTRRALWPAAAGAAVGLACLVREVHALLLLPLLLMTPRLPDGPAPSRRRQRAVALLAFLLVLAPSFLRNWAVAREPVVVSSAGGQNLYLAFGPYANGSYSSPPFVRSLAYLEHEDFREEAFLRTGRRMSAGETSRYWLLETLNWVRRAPGRTLGLAWRKLGILFNDHEVPDSEDFTVARAFVPLLKLLPTFGWIAGPGLVGLALALRRGGAASLPAGFAAALTLEVILTFNLGRYRAGLAAVWLLLAGGGLAWLASKAYWKRDAGFGGRLLLAGAAAFLSASAFRCPPGSDARHLAAVHEQFRKPVEEGLPYRTRLPSLLRKTTARPRDPALLMELGDAYGKTGKISECLRAYEASVRLGPAAVAPRLALASLFAKLGDLGRAETHVRVLLASEPGHVEGRVILGGILVRRAEHAPDDATERRLLGEAASAYRLALAADPESVGARYGLGKTLFILGDRQAARAELVKARERAGARQLTPEHGRAAHLIRLVEESGGTR